MRRVRPRAPRTTLSRGVLFLTQDREFLTANTEPFIIILVSRVRQARPLADRIAIWDRAIRELLERATSERLFELTDDGQLLPRELRFGDHQHARGAAVRELHPISRVTPLLKRTGTAVNSKATPVSMVGFVAR